MSSGFPVVAEWIWSPDHDREEVNARFEFSREFECSQAAEARITLTADSRYRLFLNDEWIGDGPARSYPGVLYSDEWPVTLPSGRNVLRVVVVHFGVDTFQYLRGDPGLFLSLHRVGEHDPALVSDTAWQCRRVSAMPSLVPRISCQQGFEEHYDATLPLAPWSPVVRSSRAGTRILPRETPLPARLWRADFHPMLAERIFPVGPIWSLALRRLLSPFGKGINLHGMAGVLTSQVTSEAACDLTLLLLGPVAAVFVDGEEWSLQHDQDLRFLHLHLTPGTHRISLAVCTEYDHGVDLAVSYRATSPLYWASRSGTSFPWTTSGPLWSTSRESNCYLSEDGSRTTEFAPPFGGEFLAARESTWGKVVEAARAGEGREIPADLLSSADAYAAIRFDEAATSLPVFPSPFDPDTRALYDLGELTCGWFEMEIDAEAGAIVDACFFEHQQDGRMQYLHQHDGICYRNSLRYQASAGRQTFTSFQRRGFRYLLLVVRGAAVRFRRIGVWESLWSARLSADFLCSDDRLNRIHAISQRTLRLCMEDTFTDCPSYEQVFWLGDARNEALFAQWAFGATDLVQHSLRLASYSLDRLPLVASQCPSGWDVIIPSFSFLWSVAVWEAYWHSGDAAFLREMAPAMRRNLTTALRHCTDHGLFSAQAWNFFDWTGIDQDRETVLHNSLLLALALQAGQRMAGVLGDREFAEDCAQAGVRLRRAIALLWDDGEGSYHDARLSEGRLSPTCSQHTSFLALLLGDESEERRARLVKNCLQPPPGMVETGSPNAMFFLLEALGKEGAAMAALERLRDYWGRMLDAGATTFWEMILPEGSEFPTRSHCHGWSSSPLYLLPSLIFGVECLEPGWRRVRVVSRPLGLDFARASICTPLGLLRLEGMMSSTGTWEITWKAPPGITIELDYAH